MWLKRNNTNMHIEILLFVASSTQSLHRRWLYRQRRSHQPALNWSINFRKNICLWVNYHPWTVDVLHRARLSINQRCLCARWTIIECVRHICIHSAANRAVLSSKYWLFLRDCSRSLQKRLEENNYLQSDVLWKVAAHPCRLLLHTRSCCQSEHELH